jgi:hypothetical protein
VYYLSYPCQKLNECLLVHKVNLHERLHTPGDARCHDTPTLHDDIDEVYQEQLSPSFIVDPDADDIEMSVVVKQKRKPIKKKV